MCALIAALAAAPPFAIAGAADPAVPAGRHPGGTAVAVIGRGVDYGARAVAERLARDGEGEIIGYDFIDDDRRPYATGADACAAALLIREGQAASIVMIRAEATHPQSLARAIGYATSSPATIIAIFAPVSSREVATVMAAATREFPRHLFILEAGAEGRDLDAQSPPLAVAENALIVTSADDRGTLTPSANRGRATIDLALTTQQEADRSAPTAAASHSKIAVARAAALAARLKSVAPRMTPAELKRRMVGLAALPAGSTMPVRGGWIADPRDHFWRD